MKSRATLFCLLLLAVFIPGTAMASSVLPPTAVPVKPCGGEVPTAKPGGGAWACTFDDEFTGSALNTASWTPQVTATSAFTSGPAGYQACYVNSTRNISVSGGLLHLTARKEAAPFACGSFTTQYTSGMLSTYTSFSQTYGRFEVRAQLPQTTAKGLQETFWLWPVNVLKYGLSWPSSGEVDFSEFYSQYASLDVPYIHYVYNPATVNLATHTNTVTATNCQISLAGYNDYAVVWSPGSFTITINGATCLVDDYVPYGLTAPQPFDQPFFVALTQALGVTTNAFNPATTPLPATTAVDYVRVWK